MKKLLTIVAILFAVTATAQVNDSIFNAPIEWRFVNDYTTVVRIDTVRCILYITNSKLDKLQNVPGYVILQGNKVKGYLSRRKKVLPRRVEVWGYSR